MINHNPGLAIEGTIESEGNLYGLIVFPAGTKDTASTRLRVWPILDMLSNKRKLSFVDLHSSKSLDQPILWFQKRLTEQHLLLAHKFKQEGSYIIYDCDESGTALSYWAEPHLVFEMFHIADRIVTDTPERLQWIKRSGSLALLSILENQIDYGMPQDWRIYSKNTQSGPRMRILWYGNSCNLIALKDVSRVFQRPSEYQLVLCGANADDAKMVLPDVDFEIHPWSRAGFLDLLGSCDLCIVSHIGTRSDQRKSGHKMITSICHGVPTVASATPDYLRIAIYAGIEEYLFSSASELELILKRLRDPEARRKFISVAKPRLMKRYHPGSFARNVITILGDVSNEQKAKSPIRQALLRLKPGLVASKFFRRCGKMYWRLMQA